MGPPSPMSSTARSKGSRPPSAGRSPGAPPWRGTAACALLERDQTFTIVATGIYEAPSPGIDRIDQDLPLGPTAPGTGTYSVTRTGAGVTAYVLDTGVMAGHVEFGGRVEPGTDVTPKPLLGLIGGSAPRYGNTDCNGHGTHVAGTIGGNLWGVAQRREDRARAGS